jgi:hypothetical protein
MQRSTKRLLLALLILGLCTLPYRVLAAPHPSEQNVGGVRFTGRGGAFGFGIVFIYGSVTARNISSEPIELMVGGHCTVDLRAYRSGANLVWSSLRGKYCQADALVIELPPGGSAAFRDVSLALLPPWLYRFTVVLPAQAGATDAEVELAL